MKKNCPICKTPGDWLEDEGAVACESCKANVCIPTVIENLGAVAPNDLRIPARQNLMEAIAWNNGVLQEAIASRNDALAELDRLRKGLKYVLTGKWEEWQGSGWMVDADELEKLLAGSPEREEDSKKPHEGPQDTPILCDKCSEPTGSHLLAYDPKAWVLKKRGSALCAGCAGQDRGVLEGWHWDCPKTT